jgi:hypothetical protein
MDCPAVKSLSEALESVPNSVFPVEGLRRSENGQLSDDAMRTIMDGMKSRGIDITDKATKSKLVADLMQLFCKVNAKYSFLIEEIGRRVTENRPVEVNLVDTALKHNHFLSDILTISRHLISMKPFDGSSEFIEGWQNMSVEPATKGIFPGVEAFQAVLETEEQALKTRSLEQLRKHMVTVTQEKNKHAANYLGLYGFLNLVAVGLLIYVAGMGVSGANNGNGGL